MSKYPANETGIITVIPEVYPDEENNTSPIKPVNAITKGVIPMNEKATGNPIGVVSRTFKFSF